VDRIDRGDPKARIKTRSKRRWAAAPLDVAEDGDPRSSPVRCSISAARALPIPPKASVADWSTSEEVVLNDPSSALHLRQRRQSRHCGPETSEISRWRRPFHLEGLLRYQDIDRSPRCRIEGKSSPRDGHHLTNDTRTVGFGQVVRSRSDSVRSDLDCCNGKPNVHLP